MEHLIARVAARAGRKRAENVGAKAARASARRILVVGVGSAGCSAAEWVFEETPEVATVTVNTDRLSLEIHKSETKVLLGARMFRGHGAQGHIDAARRAARETEDQIIELVKGFDIVVVLTALGGGTGTGATPVVAAAARAQGAAVVVVAALPMRAERSRRERALAALPDLKREAHTTILLDNEALLPIAGHLPVGTALGVMDYFMAEVPRALVRSVELSDTREVAQAEARALVLAGGIGTVVYGEWQAEGDSPRAQHALVEPAGGSPNFALIHISSGDGRPPLGAENVLRQIAARLKSERLPTECVRISVAADPAIQCGGSLVSVVTGIADPCAGRTEAPAVTLEPTRVVGAPAAPPAREVESATEPAPSVDLRAPTR
jgi:cell division protein FtsZ